MEHRAAWQLTRNAFVEYQDWAYGHVQHDSQGALWLPYWLYYYHQDSIAIGDDHEGDWEMAQVRLGSDQTPDLVAYRQHQDGERCSWRVQKRTSAGTIQRSTSRERPTLPISGRGRIASTTTTTTTAMASFRRYSKCSATARAGWDGPEHGAALKAPEGRKDPGSASPGPCGKTLAIGSRP